MPNGYNNYHNNGHLSSESDISPRFFSFLDVRLHTSRARSWRNIIVWIYFFNEASSGWTRALQTFKRLSAMGIRRTRASWAKKIRVCRWERWCEVKIFKESFLLVFHLSGCFRFLKRSLWFGNSYECFLWAWNYGKIELNMNGNIAARKSLNVLIFVVSIPLRKLDTSNSPQNHEKWSNNFLFKPRRCFAYRVDDELIWMEFIRCLWVTQFKPKLISQASCCVIIKIKMLSHHENDGSFMY